MVLEQFEHQHFNIWLNNMAYNNTNAQIEYLW